MKQSIGHYNIINQKSILLFVLAPKLFCELPPSKYAIAPELA